MKILHENLMAIGFTVTAQGVPVLCTASYSFRLKYRYKSDHSIRTVPITVHISFL